MARHPSPATRRRSVAARRTSWFLLLLPVAVGVALLAPSAGFTPPPARAAGVGPARPSRRLDPASLARNSQLASRWASPVTPPSGVRGLQRSALYALACPAAGECAAGGTFQEGNGHGPVEAMVASQFHGRWRPATALQLPPGAPPQPYAQVNGLSCATPGNCVAVGDYLRNQAGQSVAFIARQVGGRWARAFLALLPANSAAVPSAQLNAVSCLGGGFCEAVGSYLDRAGQQVLMAVTKLPRRPWGRAVPLAAPAAAGANPRATATGLDCITVGACVAVGDFQPSPGRTAALGAAETGRRWQRAVAITPPAGARFSAIRSVSCTRGGCVGVGEYSVAPTTYRAMSVTESGGLFSAATPIRAAPAGVDQFPTTDLSAISCSAGGRCVAAGVATNRAGRYVAMYMTSHRGHWGDADFVREPSDVGGGIHQGSALYAAACPPGAACVAAGSYNDNSGGYRAVVALAGLREAHQVTARGIGGAGPSASRSR